MHEISTFTIRGRFATSTVSLAGAPSAAVTLEAIRVAVTASGVPEGSTEFEVQVAATRCAVIPPATTKKSSPPPAVIPRTPAHPPGGRPDETDFSDLGFDGPPEALGSLLGQPPELPPLHEVADVEAYRPTGFEEDEVFTSAVRPGSVMPAPYCRR